LNAPCPTRYKLLRPFPNCLCQIGSMAWKFQHGSYLDPTHGARTHALPERRTDFSVRSHHALNECLCHCRRRRLGDDAGGRNPGPGAFSGGGEQWSFRLRRLQVRLCSALPRSSPISVLPCPPPILLCPCPGAPAAAYRPAPSGPIHRDPCHLPAQIAPSIALPLPP
jgi:hypothetical protein